MKIERAPEVLQRTTKT